MSERMTAAEWHAKLDEIIKHDPDIDSDCAVGLMADLAAVETENERLKKNEDFWDCFGELFQDFKCPIHGKSAILCVSVEFHARLVRAEKAEAERDEANGCAQALERRAAAVTIDNARLREALRVACRLMGHADIDWPESIAAALAATPDAMVERVRAALVDGRQACFIVGDECEARDEGADADDWRKTALRLDALLREIGGKA